MDFIFFKYIFIWNIHDDGLWPCIGGGRGPLSIEGGRSGLGTENKKQKILEYRTINERLNNATDNMSVKFVFRLIRNSKRGKTTLAVATRKKARERNGR